MRFTPVLSRSLGLVFGIALFQGVAQPGAADTVTPMTAAEFNAYVEGKTLTWSQYGAIFGIEEYLPNRKVRWKTSPDECQYGSWFEREGQICFVYEYGVGEHCWTFWTEGEELRALSANGFEGSELTVINETPEPLACPAPDVGV
ncbi:hypothetical protein [Paracoccus sp. IB05]|uniref:hypothetical protein n=1 Tax=Paracoccus sp. IB05 TaxID=2779367 RepID=UPI0018E7FB70|nr:hypothetical protein [Paracoccus sp. IB05]MBJ2150514.1 hypothetical protein [Paracoccus sp. IB05]